MQQPHDPTVLPGALPVPVDDGAARRDWRFSPRLDFHRAFAEYLIPTIQEQYAR